MIPKKHKSKQPPNIGNNKIEITNEYTYLAVADLGYVRINYSGNLKFKIPG